MMMQKILGEIDDLIYPPTFCPLLSFLYCLYFLKKKAILLI